MEYVHKRTRNPFRIARAVWRVLKDPESTPDVLIVEDVFNHSRLTRRIAAWESVAERHIPGELDVAKLAGGPRLINFEPAELLSRHAPHTVGYALGSHMLANNLNPNLFKPLEITSKRDYMVSHIIETHDIWHVVTGYGTDLPGEAALLAFYAVQIGAPIFPLLLGLALLNTAFAEQDSLAGRMEAISRGWQSGKQARPLFGIDWTSQFDRPVLEFRREYQLPEQAGVGAGISLKVAAGT